MANKEPRETVIDAEGLILGRMASQVAKRLLNGEKIIIVNAEKAIISGKRLSILREKQEFLQVGHFRKGPLHPRRPDRIVKKAIRGMLPRKKPRGKDALKRLKVYIGVPKDYEGVEKEKISEADGRDLRGPYIKVSELARNIGWKG
ncbi:50S ribosomal protein L13 [Candidatus Bathyarchaeota archaeon]|nr:50S ribosomal protein L13 [Candidatus Bathyarchaeota archaeon]RJS87683.1 MAG: 50S ribosomal protein L13 [Candidatus Bathyarchaeota archaeon]